MPKDLITTENIVQAIMHRITTGLYKPGENLPSVRNLASDIGSNRNTVNKAYQTLLELGVIEGTASGRRGYSVKKGAAIEEKTKAELLDYFYQQSVELVWHGMAAGISSDEILEQLKSAVGDVCGHSQVRLIFYECNQHDTTEMGRSLNETLKMPVDYKVLDNLYKNLKTVPKNYDLVITTYHHLAEIIDAFKEIGEHPDKIVGIETRPSPDTMLRVARLSNSRVGVVCTNQNTAHMLKHIFYGYHPEWEVKATSLEHPDKIAEIAQHCDHFIVTHTCAEEVTAMTGRTPDVVVQFQIDEQSVAFLRQRIYDIQMEKLKPLHSLSPAFAEK
jgi:DNA-binding transcriptional regulator YhcF (GntR family)